MKVVSTDPCNLLSGIIIPFNPVIARVGAALVPQLLEAVTLRVPDVAVVE